MNFLIPGQLQNPYTNNQESPYEISEIKSMCKHNLHTSILQKGWMLPPRLAEDQGLLHDCGEGELQL